MVLSDDSVKFPVDSSKLSPEAQQRLTDFAEKLKTDNRNVYVEIQGHTDGRGKDPINERLGEQRAEAVRLFMNQHGVPLNRMSTISYGKADPVADNKTKTGRAQKPPRRPDRHVLNAIGGRAQLGRPPTPSSSPITGPRTPCVFPEDPSSATRSCRPRSACCHRPATAAPRHVRVCCGRPRAQSRLPT